MGSGSSAKPTSTALEEKLASDTPDLKLPEISTPRDEGRRSTRDSSPCRTECKFFARDGQCKFGDRCRYSHDIGGMDVTPSSSDRRRTKGKGDGKGKKSATPCRDFLKGSCRYGDSCYYSHAKLSNDENNEDGNDEHMLILTESDVVLASSANASEALSFDEAMEILREAEAIVTEKATALQVTKNVLVPEVQSMEDDECTSSGGIQWQFRGKRSEGNFYDFEEDKSSEIEDAYQAWVDAGKSTKHSDRRYEIEVKGGHKISLDFHLSTQRAAKGAVRVIRRYELPSKAYEKSKGYFDSVLALVGDACDKIETVNGRMASMGLTADEKRELAVLEDGSIKSMSAIINGFIQLALLCNAGDLLEKLCAVLGPARSARLGVEASGRNMRLKAVCKALRVAFERKSYSKPLAESESGWARVQVLCTMGRFFYGQPVIKLRQNMVKYRNDSMQMSRRHAFMLAGMLLNECSDDTTFTAECKKQIRPLLQEGLQIAMTSGGDMEAIGSILSSCRAFESGFIDITPVESWLTSRLRSSIFSSQPVEWTAELLSEIRGFVGIDASQVVFPVIDDLVEKSAKEISDGATLPEKVNQFAIFSKLCDDFDVAIFDALTPFYEDTSKRAVVTEWLIAYCEHLKIDLPDYCMTSDQAECFENLTNALNSFGGAGGDTSVIKAAVVAAKLVPNLKDNPELCEVFENALAVLKEEARLPPGWDLEDLLGTEKLFKKERVTALDALALFQKLMDSTHQKRWTRDRATRGDGEKIADRFIVTHVTEIQNQGSWENYDRRRQEIIKSCKTRVSDGQWDKWSGPVLTRELGDQIAKVCKLTPLEPNCNEFLMFHGAKPLVADLIAENHFDISFASKDGMFGAGLYFAEASSKSDEYCSPNDADEFPLILVRCTLGKINYVDAPKPYDNPGRRQLEHSCMSGTYNSVLGDRIKVSGTYREFVVYDHFQAYPHFILWYRRE